MNDIQSVITTKAMRVAGMNRRFLDAYEGLVRDGLLFEVFPRGTYAPSEIYPPGDVSTDYLNRPWLIRFHGCLRYYAQTIAASVTITKHGADHLRELLQEAARETEEILGLQQMLLIEHDASGGVGW